MKVGVPLFTNHYEFQNHESRTLKQAQDLCDYIECMPTKLALLLHLGLWSFWVDLGVWYEVFLAGLRYFLSHKFLYYFNQFQWGDKLQVHHTFTIISEELMFFNFFLIESPYTLLFIWSYLTSFNKSL